MASQLNLRDCTGGLSSADAHFTQFDELEEAKGCYLSDENNPIPVPAEFTQRNG